MFAFIDGPLSGPVLILRDQKMTKTDQPKPPSLPLLLVYGKPTSPDLPQASWFSAEDRLAVNAAAHTLRFQVIDIVSEADLALLPGVHEGVLKSNGRMIVGSVAVDDYQRIEERLREGTGVTELKATGSDPSGAKAAPEQNKNLDEKGVAVAGTGEAIATTVAKPEAASGLSSTSDKPITAAVPDPWDTLRIGAHILAKEWDEKGSAIGWWVGTITGFAKQDFVIVWLEDIKKTTPIKVKRKHIAILHPSYDVRREWDDRK
jgi:hypothetical protein